MLITPIRGSSKVFFAEGIFGCWRNGALGMIEGLDALLFSWTYRFSST
jgi:hypothetical protein